MVDILTASGSIPVTFAVLDAVLASKAGENPEVEHLTVAERHQLAAVMGWEMTAAISRWCSEPGPNDRPARDTGPDYEGAILRRQEADPSYWG